MIEKIKIKFGENTEVISVQEYYTDKWNKLISSTFEEQIAEASVNKASILSLHIKVESWDEDNKEIIMVDTYPDMDVAS